jgi:hypothetical protein
MRKLIVYPHGLGDCILATPALRALKEEGHFIGFATQERFRSARLLDGCPYVDELFYTKDVWNDFSSLQVGQQEVLRSCREMSKKNGYDECIFVWHKKGEHKITGTARILGVELKDLRTEVFISDDDTAQALPYFPASSYGFVQTNTGVPRKDLPKGHGATWLKKHFGVEHIIEVGETFQYNEISIGAQFVLMGSAASVCVPDSVFFHAACAMQKRVDLAYFARGPEVYDVVKPLHKNEHSVRYHL